MVIRITYTHVPPGHNGPVTRMTCGYGDADAFLRRYAQHAARQFLAATVRPQGDGSYVVTRLFPDSASPEILATIVVEPAS